MSTTCSMLFSPFNLLLFIFPIMMTVMAIVLTNSITCKNNYGFFLVTSESLLLVLLIISFLIRFFTLFQHGETDASDYFVLAPFMLVKFTVDILGIVLSVKENIYWEGCDTRFFIIVCDLLFRYIPMVFLILLTCYVLYKKINAKS